MSNVVALRAEHRAQTMPPAAERGHKVAENKRTGFVLLYRSVQDAPFKQQPERFCVWIHLLMEAGFEAGEVTFNRNVLQRRRGQVVTSAKQLGLACGVTEDSARRSLEYFEREGMVTMFTKRGHRGYSLITLRNYDDYQRGIETAASFDADLQAAPSLASEGGAAELGASFETCSAGFHAELHADLHAELKAAPLLASEDGHAEYDADLQNSLRAEDLNNINNKTIKDLSNRSCPVSGETEPHAEQAPAGADLVIDHLNQVTGSRYQKKPTSRKPINGRLSEGFTVDDLRLVIEFKHEHWGDNPEMAQYLRPATLFGTEKFGGYLSAAQRWEGIGRPRCINGQWEGFERTRPGSAVAQAQAQSRAWQAEHGPAYDDNTVF